MDTVGVDTVWRAPLRCPAWKDGRLYGRGSYDMKGSLAAIPGRRGRGEEARPCAARCGRGGGRRGGREHRHRVACCIRPPVRRRGRGRAHRARRRDRSQRLRGLRDRDPRPTQPTVPARSRRGRDRAHGPCSRPSSTSSRPRLLAQPGHPLLGQRPRPRLADRGRAGVLELPRALPRSPESGARCPASPLADVERELHELAGDWRAPSSDVSRQPFEVGGGRGDRHGS